MLLQYFQCTADICELMTNSRFGNGSGLVLSALNPNLLRLIFVTI